MVTLPLIEKKINELAPVVVESYQHPKSKRHVVRAGGDWEKAKELNCDGCIFKGSCVYRAMFDSVTSEESRVGPHIPHNLKARIPQGRAFLASYICVDIKEGCWRKMEKGGHFRASLHRGAKNFSAIKTKKVSPDQWITPTKWALLREWAASVPYENRRQTYPAFLAEIANSYGHCELLCDWMIEQARSNTTTENYRFIDLVWASLEEMRLILLLVSYRSESLANG